MSTYDSSHTMAESPKLIIPSTTAAKTCKSTTIRGKVFTLAGNQDSRAPPARPVDGCEDHFGVNSKDNAFYGHKKN